MIIEPYTDAYKEQVGTLVTTIQQVEFNVPITLADQPDLYDIPNVCQIGKGNFWIARIGEEVLGTIALLDNGEDVGTLRKMFVKKEYRGKEWGIAHKLLDALLAWAQKHHYQGIYLGTIDRLKAAQRFYEKTGFRRIAPENLPAVFPRMIQDDVFFEYVFS